MAARLSNASVDQAELVLEFWSTSAEDSGRPADDAGAVRRLIERDPEALMLAAAEARFVAAGATRADAMVLDHNAEAHGFWARAGYAPQQDWSRWVKPLA